MSIKLLDQTFSQFIRLSQTDENGFGRCISCNKPCFYDNLDAGHFVNRKHMSLKFSEINVNIQCRQCNRFDEGNIPGYSIGLIKKHGSDIVTKLLAQKHQTTKFTAFEIKEFIKYYRAKNKQLASDKTFKINLK